ncbi:zinc finger protein 239 [Labrus bergylta]|uniref:zinc finger protein 239 n=1 Tax=Labrus bergylta TaxID=56723 RepID=UPI0009B3E27C|nr:zinc finger protein 239-like [Labrus bergylta]
MSSRLSLNSQLSSIMETMARSALSQVCKLVDEDSCELRSQLTRLLAANSALEGKVSSLQCELTVVRSDGHKVCNLSSRSVGVQTVSDTDGETNVSESPAIAAVFGKDWCMNLWKDRDPSRDPSRSERVMNDPPKLFDKSMEAQSEQITVTALKEEDCVEDALSSCQQETLSTEDHREGMAEEPEQLSGGSSSFNLPLDQDGEKVVSSGGIGEPAMKLISIDDTGEALSTTIIPIDDKNDDDDDEDVQFIDDSQQELMMNSADGLIYNRQQNFKNGMALDTDLNVDLNMVDFEKNTCTYRDIYTCDICNLNFIHSSTFTFHMKTHKENYCSICGQFFIYRHKLITHTCVHPYPSKNSSCELCGKVFANPSSLRLHYLVHTGEKPYTCRYCGKGFSQKGNLNCHLRIHTGERPFWCVKCGKAFTQKVNLKYHMNSHR